MKKVFLATMALSLALTACHNNEKADVDIIRNPISADGIDESMKMPQISFESDMHDFGQLMAGENISYSFKFTNTRNPSAEKGLKWANSKKNIIFADCIFRRDGFIIL